MKRNKILFALMMCFALVLQPSAQSFAQAAKKPASAAKKGKKKAKKKKAVKVDGTMSSTMTTSAPAPKSGADYSIMNFLPFGIGQFTQGKTIVGATFAASQAGMLFLFLDRKKQVDLSNKDADTTYNEILADGGEPSQEQLDYLTANENYVKKTQQEANLALIGFFGLYALGVADAIWDPLGLRPSKSVTEVMTEQEKRVADAEKAKPQVGLFVLPTGDRGEERTYGFTLNKSFR